MDESLRQIIAYLRWRRFGLTW